MPPQTGCRELAVGSDLPLKGRQARRGTQPVVAPRRSHNIVLTLEERHVKYMLMMHAPRAGWKDAGIGTWPPEDIKAHIEFMHGFNKELTEAGELVGAQGLACPEEARVVRAGQDGAPEVTDGPFAEAKEFLAGYWIVDVREHGARLRDRRARLGGARARAACR